MAVTGRAVLLMALGLVAVLLTPALATAWVWIGLVALAVAGDVLSAPAVGVLHAERAVVEPRRLHEPGSTTLVVRNTGSKRARGLLRDAWQPSAGAADDRHALDLAPGADTRLTTTLLPVRRGDLRADRVTVRLLGPLGLAARQRSVTVPGVLRVLPAFPSRKYLPGLLSELRLLDGRSAVRARGQGTEFDSLRDYVPGDDVRSIDWRATARRTQLVVRTWRPERDRQIVILLDTSRTTAARIEDVPRLDAAMDAALLLTALATRAGDRVDVVAGDREVRCLSSGGRGAAGREDRLHQVVERLAPLEPSLVEANWPDLASAGLDLARGGALFVLLTPLEPVVVEETLLPALDALGSRHRVVLASVQDPSLHRLAAMETTDPGAGDGDRAHEAAAAEGTLARRRRTAEVLEGLGVTVLDRPPGELPLELCRTYLDLKARGML